MLKIYRNYKATFEVFELQDKKLTPIKVITIQNPTTCHLNIDMDIAGQASLGVFQFVNLSEDVRAYLWRDLYVINSNKLRYIKLTFEAGYGDPTDGFNNFFQTVVYKGIVQYCTSYKAEGSTDWLTDVQAIPSDIYEYAFVNSTFGKGTRFEDVINYMLQTSNDTTIGYITSELPTLPRDKTFIGRAIDLLNREYGGYEIFIDRGRFNVLGDNDVLPGDIMVITDASGLLGSPRRAMQYLEVDMIFEPQLKIGQAVTLDSKLMPQYNQLYKVMAIQHQGTISDRIGGRLTSKVSLWAVANKADLKTLKPAKTTKYEAAATTQWIKPVQGRLTDSYGWRIHPIYGDRRFHEGIDIGTTRSGIPIYAPANGVVTFAGTKGGYGRYVELDNGSLNGVKVTSGYGHMSRTNVRFGQTVTRGKDILGWVGSTGQSTGPHLHFEVRENGKTVNPIKYVGNY